MYNKKENLRMQMLAGIITESEYRIKVNERYEFQGKPSVYSYITAYFNEDRSRGINPDPEKHKNEIIQNIKNDWGDDYVLSAERMNFLKNEIKGMYKYYGKNQSNPEFQKRMKSIEVSKERYKNNLLPLTYSGSIRNKPDSKYYSNTTKYYTYTNDYGDTQYSNDESREYTLDSRHINTQVDKETLDKHWQENVLRYLGLKK